MNRRWNAIDPVPDDAFDAYVTWMLEVYAALDEHPEAPLAWTTGPDRSVLDALASVLDAHPPAPVGC